MNRKKSILKPSFRPHGFDPLLSQLIWDHSQSQSSSPPQTISYSSHPAPRTEHPATSSQVKSSQVKSTPLEHPEKVLSFTKEAERG